MDSCDYGEASYWEGYYKHHAAQRGTDTEWYAPLAAFQKMMPTPAALRSLLGKGAELRTLVLGCGNSELSLHLRDAGYGHIVSVDISEVCVQQMRSHHAGDTRLSFEVGDVRDMRKLFADGSFVLVVDKATLDAVFIATGTGSTDGENFEAVDEFLRESRRVLVGGGVLVSLSHMDRAGFFTPPAKLSEGDTDWTVEAARVWRVDRSAAGSDTRFGYYCYACTVGQPESQAELEPAAAATVRMIDVLAMPATQRQELVQQLPALLAACEITEGFDVGARDYEEVGAESVAKRDPKEERVLAAVEGSPPALVGLLHGYIVEAAVEDDRHEGTWMSVPVRHLYYHNIFRRCVLTDSPCLCRTSSSRPRGGGAASAA